MLDASCVVGREPVGACRQDDAAFAAVLKKWKTTIKKMAAVVMRIGRSVPVTRSELEHEGVVGLWLAWQKFEGDREDSALFRAYARKRVWGAMVDYLRMTGGTQRSWIVSRRLLDDVEDELRRLLGREPTHDDIRLYLGLSEKGYKALCERAWQAMVSVDATAESEDGDEMAQGFLAEDGVQEELTHQRELERIVLRALFDVLDERELKIVVMYFWEELNMAEIADVFALSESRVSQLLIASKRKLLYRLLREIGADDLPFPSDVTKSLRRSGLRFGKRRLLVSLGA